MVDEIIYDEVCCVLTRERILRNAKRNGELPFGFVIDYIKDIYGICKSEGWETAKAVCKYFNL